MGRNIPTTPGLRAVALSLNYPRLPGKFVERIFVFGGYQDKNSVIRGSWLYNPNVNSWFLLSFKTQPQDRTGCLGDTLQQYSVAVRRNEQRTETVEWHLAVWQMTLSQIPLSISAYHPERFILGFLSRNRAVLVIAMSRYLSTAELAAGKERTGKLR